ncbi:MAG: hypothetical protein HYY14_02945 [Candidatus Omnitrophica bacterium]|nr:hypothetical protein [Candidatus Omnitrophota bacterium]
MMRAKIIGLLSAGAMWVLLSWGGPAQAGDPEVGISVLPLRYISVDGDRPKFREHQWMRDRYVFGVEDFEFNYGLADGTQLSSEAHALIDQNDLGGEITLKKEGLGFLTFDYNEFSKYFDNTGGVYYRFGTLSGQDADKDLELEIGHFGFKTGLRKEDVPEITFTYEREFKDGAKSRLTWAGVKEGSTTRFIGPSWQDFDERVDMLELEVADDFRGARLTGKQHVEFVRTESTRVEKSLSTTTTASDKKIRRQLQSPESDLYTTFLGAERWFWDRKLFTSGGYQFAYLNFTELEDIFETNENGVITNFSNPKQKRDATADNDYFTHTWVGNAVLYEWEDVAVGLKLKSELVSRDSNSRYPEDSNPNSSGGSTPDGFVEEAEISTNDSTAVRWGEGLNIHYTGIPYTALYSELELEQSRIKLEEQSVSYATGAVSFERDTITDADRGTVTVGGRVTPVHYVDLTTHYRHRRDNQDYDDLFETDPGSTAARSAFMDGMSIDTDEIMARVSLRPVRKVRTSFRYQLQDKDYLTRAESEPRRKSEFTSHTYTYDLTIHVLRELMLMGSFSHQTAATVTPARLAASGQVPVFNADVNTWLVGADYMMRPNLTLDASAQYSEADNFNDFTSTGLPLGADFGQIDLTCGLRCELAQDTSVRAEYGYYHYQPGSQAEIGKYKAHLVSLAVSKTF